MPEAVMIYPPDENRADAYARRDATPVKLLFEDGSIWSGMPIIIDSLPSQEVEVTNFPVLQEVNDAALGTTNAQLAVLNAFTPSLYDNITLSYTSTNLTGVVFKLGAVVVSTLTLSYNGDNQLITVVKS